MSVTIKFRRGSSSEWTSNGSTILASGEPGYEMDTGRFKIGNGITEWNSLSYATVIPTGFLAGSGISVVTGSNGSTATISVSGLNSSYISDFNEAVDDRIGSGLFIAGTGIHLTYIDEPSDSFTVSVSGLINNPANNRILTSRDSSTVGIDAESNLTFDGTTLTVIGDAQANYFFGNFDGPIVYDCKNDTGSTINIGTPVYIAGHYANGKVYVAPADSSDSTKMPALGLLGSTLAHQEEGYVLLFGALSNVDTSAYSDPTDIGKTLFVASGGGLTLTRPTGENILIQNIARIARISNNNGRLLVLGPARTNDVPNSITSYKLNIDNIRIDDSTISSIDGGNIYISGNSPDSYLAIKYTGIVLGDYNNPSYITTTGNWYLQLGANDPYGDGSKIIVGGSTSDNLLINGSANGDVTISGGSIGRKVNVFGDIQISGVNNDNILISSSPNGNISVSGVGSNTVGVYGKVVVSGVGGENVTIAGDSSGDVNIFGGSSGDIAISGVSSNTVGVYGKVVVSGVGGENVTIAGDSSGDVNIFGGSSGDIAISGVSSNTVGVYGKVVVSGTYLNDVTIVGGSSAKTLITCSNSDSPKIIVEDGSNGNIIVSGSLSSGIILHSNSNIFLNTGDGAIQCTLDGDSRGQYANDFQRLRTQDNEVAAGNSSVICGGEQNKVPYELGAIVGGRANVAFDFGFVGGGYNNRQSTVTNGYYNTIVGGYSNEITASTSSPANLTSTNFIGGGDGNIIYEATSSVIGGGFNNYVYGQTTSPYGNFATIPGGYEAKTTDRAQLAYANGKFDYAGDAQYSLYVVKGRNSISGFSYLYLDYDSGSGSIYNIIMPYDSVSTFIINISGREEGTSQCAGFIIRGTIKSVGGTVSLVGSPIIESFLDTDFSSGGASARVGNSGSGLSIEVANGSSISGTVRWVATVQISRVVYGSV